MEQMTGIVNILATLKDNPTALMGLLAFASLGVSAWAIYAVVVIAKKQSGDKP